MQHPLPLSRRQFLGAAALGVVSANSVFSASPPVRTGTPHLKLGLAAYSFSRQLERRAASPAPGRMTLLDFIDFCAEQNVDGAELTSYYFPQEITPEYLNSLKERTFRLGLDVSGTAIGNDFCLPEGEKRDAQLQLTREWIEYAAAIGAPVIRIFAGNVPSGDSEEAALERCVAGINDSLVHAARHGVVLALENHGGITATPQQLLKIVEAVSDSPWFGVNFDSGNFHSDNPYRDLEMIAPYAMNAQVKVSMVNERRERQPADFKQIVEILKSAGYRGYVTLEYEEKDDPLTEVPKYLKALREAIQ